MAKTLTIDPVTRIEGHAKVFIDLGDDGKVVEAGLVVNELRGFERILVGMEANAMPQVTARICGVCPTAHHLVAAKALDAAANVDPPPAAKAMRELMYMGHFIHSHALHLFALAGPDLVFGFDAPPEKRNIIGMVEAMPEVSKKALRLRTLGQKVNEKLGGRGVHPVTAVVGGVSFRLTEEDRKLLETWVDEALVLGLELAAVVKQLLAKQLERFPALLSQLSIPSWYLGTVKGGKLDLYDGVLRVMDAAGAVKEEFASVDYAKHLVERPVDWSYMKPVYLKHGGAEHLYRVNTLARMNVADAIGTPVAQAELEQFRKAYGRPCHATVMHHLARVIELVYSIERAKQLVTDKAILGENRVPARFSGGRGVAHIEAPRGTLIHDYEIDDKGIVRSANLLVATQQNYAAINQTIAQTATAFDVAGGGEKMLNAVEFGIRCYDPCLSCATHAVGQMPLEVVVRRAGQVLAQLRRPQ